MIGIIAAAQATASVALLVTGILISIAAGSFLYISLVEILPHELEKPGSKVRQIIKLGALLLGWGFMAFIAKFA